MEELLNNLIDSLNNHIPSFDLRKEILADLIPVIEEQDGDLVDELRAEHDVFNEAYLEHHGETDVSEDEED